MSEENRICHRSPNTRNKIKIPDLTFLDSTISAFLFVRSVGVTIAYSLSMKTT